MSGVNVKDKVVFVTGAIRGIGLAIATEAAERGARKVYAAARNADSLQNLADQFPGQVVAVELDVTDGEQIAEAAAQAGDVQILINNAGTAGFNGAIYNPDPDAARREIDVNYFGPLNVTRAFADSIVGNGDGAIANIVSIGGLSNFPAAATYSASKAAAHSLTQALRAELAPQGVGVYGVYPGPIDTDMAAGMEMDKESPQNVAARIFDAIRDGIEDVATDAFAEQFIAALRTDHKALEKENAKIAHQPAA